MSPLLASSVWLSPWEWSSSDWAGLTFVVVVVAAYVAWRQVSEARQVREDQARPFVVIDFHPWSTIIELTITNTGRTLARDVQFEFIPPLTTTHDESGRGNLMDLNLFTNGIPALAPGKQITLFFDQFPARLEASLPMTYEVSVSYTSPTGTPYSEPTVIDLSMYVGTGGVTRQTIHDVHKQLAEIAKAIKQWTDLDGLKVLTRDDVKRRNQELVARRAERAARASASGDQVGPAHDSPA